MIGFLAGVVSSFCVGGVIVLLWWMRQRDFDKYARRAMEAVEQGQYHVRMFGQHGRRAQAVSESFNHMLQVVESTISQLSQERDVLQHILHSMATGLVYVNHEGKVQMVNEAAERIFKRPREQWVDRAHWVSLRHYSLCVAIDRALLSGTPWRGEMPVSEESLLDVNLIPIPQTARTGIAQDSRYEALLLFNDVSEWRRLERMRSDFIANVSHELRTPIAAIRGFAETLLDDEDADPEIRRSFLQTIFEESKRMGNLVVDLLELSKLEREGQTVQLKDTSLGDIVDKAVRRLAKEAEERNISIEVAPDMETTVWADADKLLQVFLNLIGNAIHYTPQGGRVRIWRDTLVERVRVHVSDNGIGIPEEHQTRVFERFYRVNHDRSRASGGTGLGLAIVKHIVAVHGGEVGVTSRPGQGSDFWFTLAYLMNKEVAGPRLPQ